MKVSPAVVYLKEFKPTLEFQLTVDKAPRVRCDLVYFDPAQGGFVDADFGAISCKPLGGKRIKVKLGLNKTRPIGQILGVRISSRPKNVSGGTSLNYHVVVPLLIAKNLDKLDLDKLKIDMQDCKTSKLLAVEKDLTCSIYVSNHTSSTLLVGTSPDLLKTVIPFSEVQLTYKVPRSQLYIGRNRLSPVVYIKSPVSYSLHTTSGSMVVYYLPWYIILVISIVIVKMLALIYGKVKNKK